MPASWNQESILRSATFGFSYQPILHGMVKEEVSHRSCELADASTTVYSCLPLRTVSGLGWYWLNTDWLWTGLYCMRKVPAHWREKGTMENVQLTCMKPWKGNLKTYFEFKRVYFCSHAHYNLSSHTMLEFLDSSHLRQYWTHQNFECFETNIGIGP